MIEAQGLTKRYGRSLAVDGLSFIASAGQVTGFLGPNGAGKSTTMRMILGLDAPDAGGVTVNGVSYVRLRRPLFEVGALLDATAVHGGRSAHHHLRSLALSNGIGRWRVAEVLALVGLTGVAHRRVGGFSLGMKQRLGIAATLLGDPPVVIFDEPINGLDPEGVHWIRTFMRALAAEGRTVFLSSHLMSEMAQTADRLIIVGRGRLIASTTVTDLLNASRPMVLVRTPQGAVLANLLRARGAEVYPQTDHSLLVAGTDADTVGELARAHDLALQELSAQQASLEQRYLELTGHAADYRSAAPPSSTGGVR